MSFSFKEVLDQVNVAVQVKHKCIYLYRHATTVSVVTLHYQTTMNIVTVRQGPSEKSKTTNL